MDQSYIDNEIIYRDRLKKLMDERGESCVSMSKKTGIPDKTIRNIIHGETLDPRISTLYTIIRTLKASFDYILGLAPEPPPVPAQSAEAVLHLKEQLDAQKKECERINGDIDRIRKLYLASSNDASRFSAKAKARGVALCIVGAFALVCFVLLIYLLWEISHPEQGMIRF